MDEFHFGNVKAEKASAMRRYNLFAAISKTLRILELCVALIVLSWTLTRLPLALRASAEYLRKLSAFAATPLFVFAVSNAIIAALLAQRSAAADNASQPATSTDVIYEELLNSRSIDGGAPYCAAEAEYEDKRIISENIRVSEGGVDRGLPEFRHSQSEKWEGENGKTVVLRREFRRSETEEKVGENKGEDYMYPQDELSSEEFKRTIEAFIAKQMRILHEESSAIVVQNRS